jgi:tRNA(fMet)-specific endonuclease VapC
MTRYLLDTNTVSHLFRRNASVIRRMEAVPVAMVCISTITDGELNFGIARRPEESSLQFAVDAFRERVDALAWDADASRAYGAIRADLERTGRTLAPMDLLIAAHALATGAVLVTSDRAFAQVPGLPIEDWTQ